MTNLDKFSTVKLTKIRRVLENFFYKAGTNIAFYNASRSAKYKNFGETCRKAIYKQISPFFEEKNVQAVIDRVPTTLVKIDDSILDTIINALIVSFPLLFNEGAKVIDEFLLWAGNIGGQASFDKVGLDLTFNLYNPEVLSRLRDRRNYLITSVDETTRNWIARVISSGTEQGLSAGEIARQLREQGKDMSALRAKKIVETETANAMGMVELESIKRNGSTTKRWITNRDEKVCEICGGNEQQGRIPVNEQFVMSKTTSTPAHVFCRCYLEGSIPTDTDPNSFWLGN